MSKNRPARLDKDKTARPLTQLKPIIQNLGQCHVPGLGEQTKSYELHDMDVGGSPRLAIIEHDDMAFLRRELAEVTRRFPEAGHVIVLDAETGTQVPLTDLSEPVTMQSTDWTGLVRDPLLRLPDFPIHLSESAVARSAEQLRRESASHAPDPVEIGGGGADGDQAGDVCPQYADARGSGPWHHGLFLPVSRVRRRRRDSGTGKAGRGGASRLDAARPALPLTHGRRRHWLTSGATDSLAGRGVSGYRWHGRTSGALVSLRTPSSSWII